MMDASRRSILKMFSITVAATAVAAPVVAEVATEAVKPWENPYELPFEVPEGVTYNWKRVFITSDTPDFGHLGKMVADGWKPVPLERHREHFPDVDYQSHWIERGGVVLMEKST